MGEEAVNYAHSIKVEALRQLGLMLKETERAKGQLLRGTKMEPREDIPTLSELGLSKKISKLAQDIASLPEEEFEKVKEGVVTLGRAQDVIRVNSSSSNV